jgi:hypothetical protein
MSMVAGVTGTDLASIVFADEGGLAHGDDPTGTTR